MSEGRQQRHWLPLFEGILPLSRAGAIRDAVAGVQLAAMNIPQALGYARIAGMPVVTGFYTLLLPMLAFAVFGSSRYLVVAADSATAAILAGGVSTMAPLASARYVALAGTVALLTAGLLLLARILKLGFLADFLSQTVLVGFLTGVGFQVGIAVFGGMLGLEIESHKTIRQLIEIYQGISHVHLPTVALSAAIVACVFAIARISSKIPGPLIAVAGAIAASEIWNFAGHGITVIGPVAGGLPHLALPDVHWRDAQPLIGIATSCFVMIVAQSAATARVYAERHQQRLDENEDLVGLAVANASAALSGTFVVNGSPTQTAMVESSGGQSQLAQVSTAAVVALVLLFLTHPLQYLPRCVLGSIVFIIAIKLIDLRGLNSIRKESPGEYALAATTAAVVVLIGVEQGIVVAMILSLLRIVRHSYRPHTAVLIAGEGGTWELAPPAPGTFTEPGLVMYRFSAALFYANAGYFFEQIRDIVGPAPTAVRWLVVDAEAITNIDYTAARVVRRLQSDLAASGVTLALARASFFLRADLDRHHLTDVIGKENLFARIHDALTAYAKLKK